MIPPGIVAFLERANVAQAGTRDANLVPHGHRVSGWRPGRDRRTLWILLPETARTHLLESVEDNGWFTCTVEEYPAHEAYQLKGRYLRHRAADPDDFAVVEHIRTRFLKAVLRFFGEEAVVPVRAFVQQPALAVEFEVLEIFVQTPGPGAGAQLLAEDR